MLDLALSAASALIFAVCSFGAVLVLASIAEDRDHVGDLMERIARLRPIRCAFYLAGRACRWLTNIHP